MTILKLTSLDSPPKYQDIYEAHSPPCLFCQNPKNWMGLIIRPLKHLSLSKIASPFLRLGTSVKNLANRLFHPSSLSSPSVSNLEECRIDLQIIATPASHLIRDEKIGNPAIGSTAIKVEVSFTTCFPKEIQHLVLGFLGFFQVKNFSLSSKKCNEMVNDWRNKVLNEYLNSRDFNKIQNSSLHNYLNPFGTDLFLLFEFHLFSFKEILKNELDIIHQENSKKNIRNYYLGDPLPFDISDLFKANVNRVCFMTSGIKLKVIACKCMNNEHPNELLYFALYFDSSKPETVYFKEEFGCLISKLLPSERKDYLTRLMTGKPCGMLKNVKGADQRSIIMEGPRTLEDQITPVIQLWNPDPSSV